jgi:ribulose-5-phosphate 4-epimerase/fuculose-1-phosphate aldolase
MSAVLKAAPQPLSAMHPDERTAPPAAACYRIFALLGWTEMIYNHITLRLPGA